MSRKTKNLGFVCFSRSFYAFFSLLFLFFCSAGVSTLHANETVEPIRVGLTGKYPPFNSFDSNGNLTGFDIEVAHAICERLRRPCEFRTLQWDGMIAALQAGKIDAIIGSMAITPEREREVLFSVPYYESGAQLFVLNREKPTDSPGFRIGVTLGTTYGEFAKQKFPNARIRTYKGDTEVFQDLETRRLDGMVTDLLVGSYLNQVHSARLKPSGDLLYRERIGIPVRKDEKKFHVELNAALQDFIASPDYSSLHARYFGETVAGVARSSQSSLWKTAPPLLAKAWTKTLLISLEGLGIGILFSLLLAALLVFPPPLIRKATLLYVDFIRATPFLIQLFTIYFALPALGIRFTAWWAGVLAIALHLSAYLAETIKSAYQSVPLGQRQAAQTLGLTPYQTLRHVIFPQMLPVLMVPTLNTLVAMIKDSSIVSVISVHELTMQTQQLISTSFRPIELYAIAALLYAAITYPLLLLGRKMERHYHARGMLHE